MDDALHNLITDDGEWNPGSSFVELVMRQREMSQDAGLWTDWMGEQIATCQNNGLATIVRLLTLLTVAVGITRSILDEMDKQNPGCASMWLQTFGLHSAKGDWWQS